MARVLSGSSRLRRLSAVVRAAAILLLGLSVTACPSFSTLPTGRKILTSQLGQLTAPSGSGMPSAVSATSVVRLYDPITNNQPTMLRPEFPAASVVMVGDIMLGRQVSIEMVERDDYSWPFLQTSELLIDADLALGNLETPIVSGCPLSSEGMVFCAVPRSVEGLTWAGVDGVSLANNHASTYGQAGLDETVSYLRQAGVQPIRAGILAVRDIHGIRIGILSFDDSDAMLDLDKAESITRASSSGVDVLIGLLHWGVEYQAEPSPRQRELGHLLVDAGMDVIVGAHPHRIQPVEEYGGKLIVYSLGNFVFDQMWWEETRLGEVVWLKLTKTLEGVTVTYEMTRIEIHDYGQPAVIGQGR